MDPINISAGRPRAGRVRVATTPRIRRRRAREVPASPPVHARIEIAQDVWVEVSPPAPDALATFARLLARKIVEQDVAAMPPGERP